MVAVSLAVVAKREDCKLFYILFFLLYISVNLLYVDISKMPQLKKESHQDHSYTPVHWAAWMGNISMMKILVRKIDGFHKFATSALCAAVCIQTSLVLSFAYQIQRHPMDSCQL
jgi:hypothetical protein